MLRLRVKNFRTLDYACARRTVFILNLQAE